MMFKILKVTLAVVVLYIAMTLYSVTNWRSTIPLAVSRYVPKQVKLLPTPTVVKKPLAPDDIFLGINHLRQQAKLPVMQNHELVCSLINQLNDKPEIFSQTIKKRCPNCTQVISAHLDINEDTDSALNYLQSDSTASAILKSKKLTSMCVKKFEDKIVVLAAQIVIPPSPAPERIISEEELWTALTGYRDAQKSNSLTRDESLCVYARKRVDDHLKLLQSKIVPPAYPVPAKYPLDAHEGFKKDADSGYVFEVTGKSVVAENLAYWPNAQYGVHVIEWGWDSSTEGHRETQLSNDYSTACITGRQGFFVAIFGR